MKAENLEEAKRLISRIGNMEDALRQYDSTKDKEFQWRRLFINWFKSNKESAFAVGYDSDLYICVSMEQQAELADLLRKWIKEDKQRLETL